MAQAIRNFICKNVNCNTIVPFDLKEVQKPESNLIKCHKCGKEWRVTINTTCCAVNVKFVSVEIGTKRPITVFQSFIKPR